MEKSALELLKEYRNVVEGRFDVNVKGMPQFTMVDRSDLYAFLGKRGFVDVTEERENDVVTYISKILSLKIHLYTDDDFWTIEDTNQPDDILEDGTGVQQLKQAVMVLFKAAKGIHESDQKEETAKEKPKTQSGKFNYCYDCNGEGCEKCDYTGKYAVGLNAHHYD